MWNVWQHRGCRHLISDPAAKRWEINTICRRFSGKVLAAKKGRQTSDPARSGILGFQCCRSCYVSLCFTSIFPKFMYCVLIFLLLTFGSNIWFIEEFSKSAPWKVEQLMTFFWDSNLHQCLQIWGIAIFFEGIPWTCAGDKEKTGVWRWRWAAPEVGPKKGEPQNDTLTTKRKYNILKVHSTLHTFAPTFLMGHGWVVLRPNYAFKITSYLFSSSLSTLLKQNSERIFWILLPCLIDSNCGVALSIN